MLIEDEAPDSCPNCHLTGIADNLVYCPRCGWRLEGHITYLFHVPVGCMVIICLLVGSLAGCALLTGPDGTIVDSSWANVVFLGITVAPVILYLTGRELIEKAKERKRSRNEHTVHVTYDKE